MPLNSGRWQAPRSGIFRAKSVKKVAFVLDREFADPDFAAAAVEGAILGDFEPDRHKTDNDKKSLESFAVAGDAADLEAAVERGRMLGEAQNLTRELVNEPANLLTPARWPKPRGRWRRSIGLECEVLDRRQMEQLGMGSLLGVARAAPNRRR